MDVSKRFKLRGGKIPIHRIPVMSPAPKEAQGSTLIGRWAMFNNSSRYAEQRARNGNQYLILDHYGNSLTVCGGGGHDLYHDVPVGCVTISDAAHYVHDLRIGTRLRASDDRQANTWILGGVADTESGIYAFRLNDWQRRVLDIDAVEREEIPDTPAPFVRGDRVDFTGLNNPMQGTVTAVEWEPLTDGNNLGGWYVWVQNQMYPTPSIYSAGVLRLVRGIRDGELVIPIIDDAAEPEPEDQAAPHEARQEHYVGETVYALVEGAWAVGTIRRATYERDGWNYLIDLPSGIACVRTEDGIRTPGPLPDARPAPQQEEVARFGEGDIVRFPTGGSDVIGTVRRVQRNTLGNLLYDIVDSHGLHWHRHARDLTTVAVPAPRFTVGEEVEYRSTSGRTSLGRVRTRDVRPGEEDVYTVALYSGSLVMGFESQLSSVESEAGEQHGQAEEPPSVSAPAIGYAHPVSAQTYIEHTYPDGEVVTERVTNTNPRDVWDENILVGDFVITHDDDLSWHGQVARVIAIADEYVTVQAWSVHQGVPLEDLVRVPPTFAVGDWVRVPQLADDACVVQVDFDRTMQVATEAGQYLWVRWSDASRCAGS